MEDKATYIITNETNDIVRLSGLEVFGINCEMPAIFNDEQVALDVLFHIEDNNLSANKYIVRKITDKIILNCA